MRVLGRGLVLVGALASLLCLGGCGTSTQLTDQFTGLFQSSKSDDPPTTASIAGATDGFAAGPIDGVPGDPPTGAAPGLLGSDGYDDLNMGKKFYRTGNFGLAERSFRRAVESHPRDAEAWIGLAAAYDELKRFDLADRAYEQTIAIIGVTPELLNNRGYSYLLRGDYARARVTLLKAKAMDPANPYIRNNLALLAKSVRKGKSVE
jgi:tetratricopeptide (TPR) repeat protein